MNCGTGRTMPRTHNLCAWARVCACARGQVAAWPGAGEAVVAASNARTQLPHGVGSTAIGTGTQPPTVVCTQTRCRLRLRLEAEAVEPWRCAQAARGTILHTTHMLSFSVPTAHAVHSPSCASSAASYKHSAKALPLHVIALQVSVGHDKMLVLTLWADNIVKAAGSAQEIP